MIDIDFEMLRTIGLTQAIASQLHTINSMNEGARLVRVTGVHRGGIAVHGGNAEFSARPLPALLHALEA